MIEKLFLTIGSGFLVGATLMAWSNRGAPAQLARARWKKLLVYFLIVLTALACAAAGWFSMLVLVVLIVGLGVIELQRAVASPSFGPAGYRFAAWLGYSLAAATAIALAPMLNSEAWVFLYLTVAVFDGFSQVIGQLAGRHALASRISPAKTIEGAVGGLLAAVVVGFLFRDLVGLSAPAAALFSIAICAAGLVGDLAASWVKRRAGIKDFGRLLPGQGGVLDRFDSFLGAGAFVGPVVFAAGMH